MTRELDELHLSAINKRAETFLKLKGTIVRVRVSIRKLENENFLNFITENIHQNHYHYLMDYKKVMDQMSIMEKHNTATEKKTKKYREEFSRLNCLRQVYRNTLTFYITSFTADGYSSSVMEWLVLNKLYLYNYEHELIKEY